MIFEGILLIALFAAGALLLAALLRFLPLKAHPNTWGIAWTLYGMTWGAVPLLTHAHVLAQHATGLVLHVLLAMSAYGMFAAAVIHAVLLTREDRLLRTPTHPARVAMPLLSLERLLFRFIGIGFLLLTLSLLAGAQAGGMAFLLKLQHKTVLTALAWVTFAVLLMGRWRFGWRGVKAARMLYWGVTFLFLAYVGSRVVLELILHRTTH